MKSRNKIFNGFTLYAVVIAILLVSSPAVAIPSSGSLFETNTYSTAPNIEFGSVVAGIGTAAYASIYTFGGNDGSGLSLGINAAAFTEASSWVVASLHQEGFEAYLQRSPSPVGAPDGLSLHLTYPAGSDATDSLGWALDAAEAVEAAHGVQLALMAFDSVGTHDYVFWAQNSNTSTVEQSVAQEVVDLGVNGLSTLLDVSTITGSEVFWSAYGARELSNADVMQFGAGWVDTDGIEDLGSGEYKISSSSIFGGSVTPTTINPALSRVTFTVPYPINPVENGISPATSNPLPHVTGIAQWDLKHPNAYYSLGAQSDLVLQFRLKLDSGFPNVQTEFSIDQAKLNTEGTLEATFDLTNVGSEAAEDIQVVFPLGPDFDAIANQNRSIYEMKDEFDLDTEFSTTVDLNVQVDPVVGSATTITGQFLDYSGWYVDAGTTDLAFWDSGTTDLNLFSGSIGSVATATIDVHSDNGFPEAVLTLLNEFKPLLTTAASVGLDEVISVLNANLNEIAQKVKNETLDVFYNEKEIFYVYTQDFNLHSFPYQVSADEDGLENYWFMETTIPSLASGASTSLNFRIENVPVASDTFQFFDYDYVPYETTILGEDIELPNATVSSSEENWYQVMQYMFEALEYDGRVISYPYQNDVSFGTETLLDSYFADTYVSSGAFVRYENTEGYGFFSQSNGQNLQVGDDEAVVSATVNLDKQVYHPGESKQITVNLKNSGDLDAQNLKVHLYHATLGRDWSFERRHKITTLDVGTLEAGEEMELTTTVEANSFVGYSPVFAYVVFDSDVGQGAAQLPDYLERGITEYAAAGETRNIVISNLNGALLLPQAGDVGLNPTIKEPRVELTRTNTQPDANGEFEVTYTLTNTGEADTTVYFGQFWRTSSFTLVDSTDDADALKISNTNGDYGWLYYFQINLDVGETKTYTATFSTEDGGVLWPAFVYFTIAGESTLGGSVNTGNSDNIGAQDALMLAADSQAQQNSQQSANTDSSSSSYTASSSVGAALNTNTGGGDTKTGESLGFIGYDAISFLGLMLVPLAVVSIVKRRK